MHFIYAFYRRSMIFYYSATGNTRFCAEYLSRKLCTPVIDILQGEPSPEQLSSAKEIGFMFPIYCWGVPPVMTDFIRKAGEAVPAETYLWIVASCGDETGLALKKLNKMCRNLRGRGADAIFSVTMPNTYVLLPGFDVDKPEVEKRKLDAAPARLDEIAETIVARRSNIYNVKQGSLPALRSAIFPLFEKWGVNPARWHASASCVGCGKCAAICPVRNITMSRTRPVWGERCFSCCACFHVCPVKAVDYGSITRGKSQYLCKIRLDALLASTTQLSDRH